MLTHATLIHISVAGNTCYDARGFPVPSNQIHPVVNLMTARALILIRCFYLLVLLGSVCAVHAQQEQATPEQADDVLRIRSDIAQTDVMVFDKKGRAIDNLTREQFELKIDGKSKPITFFEYLRAGSASEDAQLAAARGDARVSQTGQRPEIVVPLDRGRVVLFFVDDLHLATDSMHRVQILLKHFFENEFGQNDRAAITTGSGQLGFFEQLTGDKSILLAAASRLRAQTMATRDLDRPPMSEIQALAISRFDSDVTDFFVDRFMADNPGFPRQSAVEFVRKRAGVLLQQTSAVTKNSLQSLYSLIRYFGELPERKLLFFVSDGFLVDDQTSNVSATLRRITDAAARAGVVVYSIDARGLSTGIPDPTMDVGADPGQRLTRSTANEITSTQAPLRQLSADTGGRALLNTNALSAAASVALKETDAYYVLAWRPDAEQEANRFRRIEVSIIGRPELVVRVRRGFLERENRAGPVVNSNGSGRPPKIQAPDDVLRNAMQSRFPSSELPTSLFVSFANDNQIGSYVTISMEMDSEALTFTSKGGKQSALIDVAGIVYDDKAKPVASFKSQVSVSPPLGATAAPKRRGIAFNHQTRLKPGIYQVRVAASDNQNGRTGSAFQWIDVPDLASKQLSLSSITVGERPLQGNEPASVSPGSETVFLSISRRFARTSSLRFLTFVYNAAHGTSVEQPPDVVIQIQIFRDNQPVLTTALSKISTQDIQDLTRLPYAADIPLDAMPAGRYRLQVTIIDRIAKTSATQYVNFEVG